MKKICFVIVALVLSISLFSCKRGISENEECRDLEPSTEINLTFNVNSQMATYKDVTRGSSLNIRYIAYVYSLATNRIVDVVRATTASAKLKLPVGKYRIIGWADYAPSLFEDKYFCTDDPAEMSLVDKYNYSADDPDKMAWGGSCDISVSSRAENFEMELKPQMGQFKLVATDTPDYEYSKIIISYPKGVPAAIDAYSPNIPYLWEGVSFSTIPNDNVITNDNIFATHEETTITVQVEVYDKENRRVAHRPRIEIPIFKGGITTCKTKIFTAYDPEYKKDADGQINVKPDFDNEVIIQLL